MSPQCLYWSAVRQASQIFTTLLLCHPNQYLFMGSSVSYIVGRAEMRNDFKASQTLNITKFIQMRSLHYILCYNKSWESIMCQSRPWALLNQGFVSMNGTNCRPWQGGKRTQRLLIRMTKD